jgi:hypothetical protein
LEADGQPTGFDGCRGSFRIEGRDDKAPGFLKWGRLEYAGNHYLKFRDGSYWIKGGTDEPEDLLAYEGFANTRSGSQFKVKTYANHVRDWQRGDPDWDDGQGRGLIGALNYLASQHVNLIYFLPMNIGGDGRTFGRLPVHQSRRGQSRMTTCTMTFASSTSGRSSSARPEKGSCCTSYSTKRRRRTSGAGDDSHRASCSTGDDRPLRHHNALWNLCESTTSEDSTWPQNVKAFAVTSGAGPYDHPITVHHAGDPVKGGHSGR